MQHKSSQSTTSPSSTGRGCQSPQLGCRPPESSFESYSSFYLLSYRNLCACITGSSRPLFRNSRASSQVPQKFSLPQQFQFKLSTLTSLEASSAQGTQHPSGGEGEAAAAPQTSSTAAARPKEGPCREQLLPNKSHRWRSKTQELQH